MGPQPQADDIDWLVRLYIEICEGGSSADVAPQWLQSKDGEVHPLHRSTLALATDPRRLNIHSQDEWRTAVACFRETVASATGWSRTVNPPVAWRKA